jgi:hypothetical protein
MATYGNWHRTNSVITKSFVVIARLHPVHA